MSKFSNEQLKVISGICGDVAQISLGSMIIPFIISGFGEISGPVLILGVVMSFAFWIFSILFVKNINN